MDEEVKIGGQRVCSGQERRCLLTGIRKPCATVASSLVPGHEVLVLRPRREGRQTTVIGALDVKDAFLQVPQEREVQITTPQGKYRVLRNLPGQRIGAKAWYEHVRNYLVEEQSFQFDVVYPCLGKKGSGREMICLLIHVDDIMFTGCSKVVDVFTTELKKHFECGRHLQFPQENI